MPTTSLIPTPDSIPMPWWVFEVLGDLTFLIHIVFMNVVLGGTLILLAGGFGPVREQRLGHALVAKTPTMLALTITFGVAPLLFVQVILGHMFYTSSILMATAWILIIPILILAYYGSYLFKLNHDQNSGLAALGMLLMVAGLLYISFMFTNNLSLAQRPEVWGEYFNNRTGWLLNLSDPTLIPRYLHFLVASVAIAGLFSAIVWHVRGKRGHRNVNDKVQRGLKLFGFATILEIAIGLWWIIALPKEVMLEFMGGDMLRTIVFGLGFLLAIGALVVALLNKLWLTIGHVAGLLVLMVIQRSLLRWSYLRDDTSMADITVTPQWSVFILFLVVFVIGLGTVWYMIKQVQAVEAKGGQS